MQANALVEKEVSVTAFRRKPRSVYDYIDVPGHVVIFTRHGKREAAIMSIDTYDWLIGMTERSSTDETHDKVHTGAED